eukprot:s12665_g1.t1
MNEVIVLSAFDGIGAGPWLTWDLVGQPRAIISWKVDRAAIQIVNYHIPDVRHRGDITLLQELVSEKRLGRVLGPTRAPAWLGVQAAVIPDQLDTDIVEEPPPGEHFLAGSFAVCQTDEAGELKVRRAEDWRRSGHNATVRVQDVPTHHFIGSFVDLARRMAADLVVFGHDLLNAYRQWPVRVPAQCGTFLGTRHGVTFWYHLAMNFGATASVWNLNRGADALQQLLRGLLLLATGHYVDDFNGLDDAILGESAMLSFQDLFAALGFLTK